MDFNQRILAIQTLSNVLINSADCLNDEEIEEIKGKMMELINDL